jgi:hypothetical protein
MLYYLGWFQHNLFKGTLHYSSLIYVLVPIMLTTMSCGNDNIANEEIWTVKKVKSTYVRKGLLDSFEVDQIHIGSDFILTEQMLVIKDKSINIMHKWRNYNDTFVILRKVQFHRKESTLMSSLYPGDELALCLSNSKYCDSIDNDFLSLCSINQERIDGFILTSKYYGYFQTLLLIDSNRLIGSLYLPNDNVIMNLKRCK